MRIISSRQAGWILEVDWDVVCYCVFQARQPDTCWHFTLIKKDKYHLVAMIIFERAARKKKLLCISFSGIMKKKKQIQQVWTSVDFERGRQQNFRHALTASSSCFAHKFGMPARGVDKKKWISQIYKASNQAAEMTFNVIGCFSPNPILLPNLLPHSRKEASGASIRSSLFDFIENRVTSTCDFYNLFWYTRT